MVFSSMTFLTIFLPAVLLLYFLRSNINWRNAVLLVSSLIFYSWGEPKLVILMLLSAGVNYLCALMIDKSRSGSVKSKLWLTVGIVASVAFLIYYKYFAFLVNSMASLLHLSLSVSEKALPIGISFYTFQIMTYTVDVYRGKAKVQKNPALLLLYISCFPQLIAGPIVQYADIEDMLKNRMTTPDDFSSGARRFVIGLSKKVLLANICGAALEYIAPGDVSVALTAAGAWYAAALYTLQIYFDFSAYSDMAIGLGKIFGFTYKENFNYPYISGSVSEFWRRWHISLGSFFRDYVYIPLGGNRRSASRTVLNLLIVWALTGMWHGASWNFVLWGLYYGLLIIIERFVIGRERMERIPKALRIPAVLFLTLVGWVLFYHTDLSLAMRQLMAMFGIQSGSSGLQAVPFIDERTAAVIRKYTLFPAAAALCCLPIVPGLKKLTDGKPLAQAVSYAAATVLLIASVIYLAGQSFNPFIYFRF